MVEKTTIYRKTYLTYNNILYHHDGVISPLFLNLPCYQYPCADRIPEKAIMMDRFNAMNEIMTLLNEDGLMIPGDRAHRIVTEYMNFKIDRMGPKEALEDVRHSKEHLVGQIHKMAI